jgi:hypothetical protein
MSGPNNIVTCQPIVELRNRALLGSRPLNASRPNTRYAAVGEAVFIPCCFETREVEVRAVPSRAAPQRFQVNDLKTDSVALTLHTTVG